jgi:hypothetical protein
MGPTVAKEDRHIRELSDAEGWELFDEAARTYLDMSGETFLSSYEAGEFEDPDRPEVMSVLMLLPFAVSEDRSK